MTQEYGSWGLRVCRAFEVRPGVTIASRERSAHWGALAKACRCADGTIDADAFDGWLSLLVEYAHLWGEA